MGCAREAPNCSGALASTSLLRRPLVKAHKKTPWPFKPRGLVSQSIVAERTSGMRVYATDSRDRPKASVRWAAISYRLRSRGVLEIGAFLSSNFFGRPCVARRALRASILACSPNIAIAMAVDRLSEPSRLKGGSSIPNDGTCLRCAWLGIKAKVYHFGFPIRY